MFKKLKNLVLVCTLLLVCVCLSKVNLFATKYLPETQNKDVQKIISILKENDVPQNKIDILVQKFLNKELWDCFKEEYKHIPPQIKRKNFEKTIYPDGSFRIIKIESVNNNKRSYK